MGVTRGRKEQLIFGDCSNEVKRQRGPDTMRSGQETKKSREKVVKRERSQDMMSRDKEVKRESCQQTKRTREREIQSEKGKRFRQVLFKYKAF